MLFSASDLVKRSASQIAYFAYKKHTPKVTPGQLKGEEHAEKITKSAGIRKQAQERRGTYDHNGHKIFFCIDAVQDDKKFIEIKKVDNMNDYPEWYLHSSIMQSVFYYTLLKHVVKLDTPTFKVKEGYEQYTTYVDKNTNHRFELWFGEHKYEVVRSRKILDFYMRKVDIIAKTLETQDWKYVKDFDASFKHQEFNVLKPQFSFISSNAIKDTHKNETKSQKVNW